MEYRTNEFQRGARDTRGEGKGEASNYPRRGNSSAFIRGGTNRWRKPMVYTRINVALLLSSCFTDSTDSDGGKSRQKRATTTGNIDFSRWRSSSPRAASMESANFRDNGPSPAFIPRGEKDGGVTLGEGEGERGFGLIRGEVRRNSEARITRGRLI